MMRPGDKIFVYGTLRRGQANASVMRGMAGGRLAKIRGGLFAIGGLPFATLDVPGEITGEVYTLDSPERISTLETLERGYTCTKVQTLAGVWVWVFHLEGMEGFDPVPGGDFAKGFGPRVRERMERFLHQQEEAWLNHAHFSRACRGRAVDCMGRAGSSLLRFGRGLSRALTGNTG